jgi:hypothetical protein
VLYCGLMTSAEKNLLVLIAKQRVAELKMAIAMVNQELANPSMPEQQKNFLFMQRGQVLAAVEETEKALIAVQQDGQVVVPG